jgi:hypothetical protein
VLCILRRADDVARAFVSGFACDAPVRHGFDPADAAVLAASLRMLAFLLLNMAAQASPGGTCGDSLLPFRRNAQPPRSWRGRKKVDRALRSARAPPRPPPHRRASPPHLSKVQWPGPIRQRGDGGTRPRKQGRIKVAAGCGAKSSPAKRGRGTTKWWRGRAYALAERRRTK